MLRVARLLSIVWLAVAAVSMAHASIVDGLFGSKTPENATVWDRIIKQKTKVYVVTNVPEGEEIMRRLLGDQLLKPNHCIYVGLETIGTHGKGKVRTDLLPFNWRDGNETIIVLDRSRLEGASLAGWERLRTAMFPQLEQPGEGPGITLHVQIFEGSNALQALLDMPNPDFLDTAVAEMKKVKNGNPPKGEFTFFHRQVPVRTLSVMTNEDAVVDQVRSLKYTYTRFYRPDQADEFEASPRDAMRLVALDWNGDEEIPLGVARRLMPTGLACPETPGAADAMGVTPWMRFCRQAFARPVKTAGRTDWVVAAPTADRLNDLVRGIISVDLGGSGRRLNVCDVSYADTLAVGVYVMTADAERSRLVLQEQVESKARAALGDRVGVMYSAQDWGPILSDVFSRANDDESTLAIDESIVQGLGAKALVLLWVKEASPVVGYRWTCRRLTAPLGPFTEEAPQRPNPNARKPLGGYIYPGKTEDARIASAAYQRDLGIWEQEYREWLKRKAAHEEAVRSHPVNYQLTLSEEPSVAVTGFVKVIDMVSKTVLWSADVSQKVSRPGVALRNREDVVTGDESPPPTAPDTPETRREWTDATYGAGQDAVVAAFAQGVSDLVQDGLWIGDLKPWNRPLVEAGGEVLFRDEE